MTESSHPWRVGEWGPLGWLETALKSAGILVGVGALLSALERPVDGPSGLRLAQVVVLSALSAGLVAGIADRVLDREVVGMVFILAMVVGHVCMTIALARDDGLGGTLITFSALMLGGDLVKLAFLATTGFRVRDLPPAAVYGLTGAYAAGYAALLVMQAAA